MIIKHKKLFYFVYSYLFSTIFGGMDTLIKPNPTLWLTKRNFSTMLKQSFATSSCCNVFLHDPTESMVSLFKQFVQLYPYDYILGKWVYRCTAHLILSPTEELTVLALDKLPSLISTTEILVLMSEKVQLDSSILNVSLYRNANAHVVSPAGLWSLSENYLVPRKFRQVNRYKNLIHRRGTINLKGRKLQVTSFERPPFCYMKTTKNVTIDGEELQIYTADKVEELDGAEMKLLLIMAEKLNFTWIMRDTPKNDRYGKSVNDTWEGGILGLIYNKKIDMAFASIWLSSESFRIVNLTVPTYHIQIHYLVPRPQQVTSFWALTRPFSIEVWIAVLSALILQSLNMYGRSWINPRFPKRFRNFVITFTELMGRFLGSWVPEETGYVKIQLHLWQIAGMLVIMAYCSSLAARLAASDYEKRIDTIKQFIQANLTWGRQGVLPIFKSYFDLNDEYASQMPNHFVSIKDNEDAHSRIIKGKYAIIGKVIASIFVPEDEMKNEIFKNYRVMREVVGKYYVSFAVQPWLLNHVNSLILRLRDTGIANYHLQDVIRRRASLNVREVLIEHDVNTDAARVLGLTPLGAGFAVFINGLLISIIVFYLELRQLRPH